MNVLQTNDVNVRIFTPVSMNFMAPANFTMEMKEFLKQLLSVESSGFWNEYPCLLLLARVASPIMFRSSLGRLVRKSESQESGNN